MLSFKPTFSLSCFTFIKRLFSSSLSVVAWRDDWMVLSRGRLCCAQQGAGDRSVINTTPGGALLVTSRKPLSFCFPSLLCLWPRHFLLWHVLYISFACLLSVSLREIISLMGTKVVTVLALLCPRISQYLLNEQIHGQMTVRINERDRRITRSFAGNAGWRAICLRENQGDGNGKIRPDKNALQGWACRSRKW